MTKTYTFSFVTLLLAMTTYTSTLAQTAELLSSYTSDDIANIATYFQLPASIYTAEYDVDAYRVTYEMPYLDSIITVSGAMFIPIGTDEGCALPVITYMHGTIFKRTDAPSFLSGEGSLGYLMDCKLFFSVLCL